MANRRTSTTECIVLTVSTRAAHRLGFTGFARNKRFWINGAADALTEVLDSPAFRERLRDALSSGPTALEPTAGGGAPLTVEAIPTATDDLATRTRTLSITGAGEPSEAQIRAAVHA